MVESKSWDWKKLNDETRRSIWLEPSIESYYLIDRWKKQSKVDFLDIGCGLGRHSIQFAKANFNVTAIDLSDEAIKQAKKWSKEEKLNIDFFLEDMLNISFKDNSFDCILCRNVIAHTDTEGIKVILDKIYNILRKNGECFLTLGSKNASTFKDPKNIFVDENTRLRMDDGPEKGVPHFYADMEIIPELFKKFKIEYLSQMQDFQEAKDGSYKSFWHYLILVKKK